MLRRWSYIALLILIAAAGLALRVVRLEQRPMHGDEAVHAYKFNELWTTGRYVYDPHEYHGPTLYYLTLPIVELGGVRDYASLTRALLRLAPVLAGVATILLLLLLADGLGRFATLVAALLTAISTPLVFYSRYYIQETLLVCFTLLLIAAAWRCLRARQSSAPGGTDNGTPLSVFPRCAWPLLAGIALGLMHATKETAVLAWAALAIALTATAVASRLMTPLPAREGPGEGGITPILPGAAQPKPRALAWPLAITLALLAAAVTSVTLYSGFFTHAAGPLDAIRTYFTYADRAGGGDHTHPWYFYARILLWYHSRGPAWTEALVYSLALVGLWVAWRGRLPIGAHRGLVRFIALYAVALAGAYSVIPYKTPWCVLGFHHAFVLLAGVGAAYLWQRTRGVLRWTIAAVLVAGTLHLTLQTWRTLTRFDTYPGCPWVYAQPLRRVEDLGRYVGQLAACAPKPGDPLIKVIAENPWPLPWYLRAWPHVGYWETPPDDADADIVVVSAELSDRVAARLEGAYATGYTYDIRPGVAVRLFVRQTLRAAFEQAHAPATQEAP